ncbi:MAG: winged helix-turn-helix domain-containing protein, partial [Acidimicrobiales bacterium]
RHHRTGGRSDRPGNRRCSHGRSAMIDTQTVGAGFGARLRDVNAAIERQAAFVFGPEDRPVAEADDNGTARDLVLRALGVLADPLNYQLLLHLSKDDAVLPELCEHLGLGYPAVWERIQDLIQAGLVGRSLDQDLAGLSATGSELVKFVEATARHTRETAAR